MAAPLKTCFFRTLFTAIALLAASLVSEAQNNAAALSTQNAAQTYQLQRARAQAEAGAADGVRSQAAVSAHRPWVWEAEKNGVRMYLAGGLHLGTALDATCFSAYVPYLDRVSAVYLEVPPGSFDGQDVGQLLSRRGYVPSRAMLSSRISARAWREVQQTLEAQPALLNRVAPMEPWMVALTLAQEGYRRAGLQAQYSLDTYLTQRAVNDRKPIGGMEKPKDQILAMADAEVADQERVMLAALANFRVPDFCTAAIRKAWRTGDLAQLRAGFGVVEGSVRGGDTHYNLLAKRNLQWAKKLSAMAATGRPALFVMGVEHLITRPSGLPELLEREGFAVRRVGEGRRSPGISVTEQGGTGAGVLAAKGEGK